MMWRFLASTVLALWLLACAPSQAPAPATTPVATPIVVTIATATSQPDALPTLYTDGAYVKRSDTHGVVWLKGVEITEFLDQEFPNFDRIERMGLGKMVADHWRINVLRLALDSETVEQFLPELTKLIAYAEQHGMYVILTPHASQHNPLRDEMRVPVPDQRIADLMARLAARYRQHANVLYGLWNEPHPEDSLFANQDYERAWQQWMEAGSMVANAIRKEHPGALLVVAGGRKWARDLTHYQTHPFPFANVIYDAHDYDAAPEYHYNREMWTWIIGRYPLMINEFGGACCEWSKPPLQSEYDIQYMVDVLQIVNANANLVHYTMWAMDSGGDMSAIFLRPKLELMPRGQLLVYDLSRYAPTLFKP